MDNLTLKQKLFVEKYLENNGNATKAALYAYGCKDRNMAGVTGYRMLRNVNVRGVLDGILNRAGLSERRIAERLAMTIYGYKNLKTVRLGLKLKGYKTK